MSTWEYISCITPIASGTEDIHLRTRTANPSISLVALASNAPAYQTYWNEQVRHLSLVLLPRFPVLDFALLNVPVRAMADHDEEENRVEPGEWAREPGDQGP